MKASGQETIRSFQQADADNANKQTPLELVQQGDQMIVRTNQDKVSDRAQPYGRSGDHGSGRVVD